VVPQDFKPSNPNEPSPFDDGDIYDLILGNLDYCVDFYVDQAKRSPGPVLEIACGTGRVTLPMLRAGAQVEGLDAYAPMLDRLRDKAAGEGFQPLLHHADMAHFQLPRRYALILITFNAFCQILNQDDQISCLRACRDHLEPGGKLVFDGFFPGPHIILAPAGEKVLEIETIHPLTGKTLRHYDTRTFDLVKQTQHSINDLEQVNEDGSQTLVHRSVNTVRWVYKAEMELLLRVAGFQRWEILGDFTGKPLDKETDGMVVHAWV